MDSAAAKFVKNGARALDDERAGEPLFPGLGANSPCSDLKLYLRMAGFTEGIDNPVYVPTRGGNTATTTSSSSTTRIFGLVQT